MTELHIRQLSPEAQDQIISGVTYAEQHGLLADISCIDQEFARLRSLGEIPTPQMRLNLGAALGYIIQQHTNMQWASVTDGTTSVVVLVGNLGEQQVIIYPFDVVERRWNNPEPNVFANYYDDVIATLHTTREN